MKAKDFKKVLYAVCVIALVTVGYLSFIRKNQVGDSATDRNAKFLGLKNIVNDTKVDNQKDLSIDDTDNNSNKTDSPGDSDIEKTSNPTTSKSTALYAVKEGDTYGCIAESYYGSYEHWPDILNANSNYGNGFSEYGLHVGAILELPAIETLKPASKLCS